MTQHIVKKAKEYDRDTVPGDYATLADALPQLRRRGEGELPPLHLHRQERHRRRRLRLLVRQDARRAAPSSWPRSSSSCATSRSVRWTASAPRPAGRSRRRSCSSTTRKTRTGSSSSTSATTRTPPRPASSSTSAARSRSAPARSAAAACSSAAATTSARTPCRPSEQPDADLRLQERQDHPAAAGRARADDQAAGHRQDRSAGQVRLDAHAPAVQGLPGLGQGGGQGELRVRPPSKFPPRKERCRPRRRRQGAGGEVRAGGQGGAKRAAKRAAKKARRRRRPPQPEGAAQDRRRPDAQPRAGRRDRRRAGRPHRR